MTNARPRDGHQRARVADFSALLSEDRQPDRLTYPTQIWLPAVLGALAILYLITATWAPPYNVDAFTNAVQSRAIAADGSPILEEAEGLGQPPYQGTVAWFVSSPEGVTSQYPPGVATWGALFYLADTSTHVKTVSWENASTGESGTVALTIPSFVPAAFAAVTSVVLAMMFFGLTMADLVSSRRAMASTLVAGLGTGAWSVASDKLWQHGPAMMCISAGTWLASRNRPAWAGVAFGAAILVRPHTAVIAAAIGISMSWSRRSVIPAVKLAATSILGLALLVAYNASVFDHAGISGGYGSGFGDQLQRSSPLLWMGRMIAAFVDPHVGILVTSSFVLIGILGLPALRGRAPDWAWGAAIGGLLYLAIQLKANRVSGGSGFFSYRYPLEALMAAGPLLALGTMAWIAANRPRQRVFAALAIASILLHGLGALTT